MKKLSFFLMAMLMSIMSFAETYTHTFVKGEMKTGSVTLSGVTWNTAADPGTTAYNWDTNPTAKGIQIGTSKAPCASYTFSTSHFVDYTITNITVNASTASGGTAKMQVSVGGVDYISQTSLTTSAKDYTGAGSSSGDVVISFTNTAKAFYIKSISITYQAVSAGEGMILVDQSNVDFGKITKTQTITVTGQNLTSPITTQLQDGSNFSVEGTLTAEGGELTVNYIATEAGKHTDVLVLTSDDVTTEVALVGEVLNLEGAGTKENPYTVADILALNVTDQTKAWVQGYIIGALNSDNSNQLETTGTTVATNIVLASTADATANYIPVALPSGDVRNALNLSDNPTNLGIKVAVYGTLELYFSKAGVKNVSDYEILSTVTPEPVMFTVTATAENGTVEGDGEYAEGTEVTLTATAAEGYEFVNWTSGETEVSTANPFTFTVTSDTTLVANFKEVEPVKLYLNAKDWGYGDARFAAYFFDPAKWVDMTKVEGEAYIYEVEVPAGYTKVIFVRMNGSTTENNWGNKWNQTGNLDIPTDGKNMFKPDDWDGKTTTWSTYTPSVKYTFTEGSTWYIDFSAITGKKGANYPKANVADIDYSANAGGTVIPVTFTADVTWAEGATFIKTEEGGWDALTFTTPTEGANCAQVAADGKSYTWTTYTPVVSYDVTVADATVTTEQWSIDLAGSWNDQALTIRLWQDNTQGFGSYAPNADTGYYILLGAKELTPTTAGVYADNGDGTFTFTATATDAEGAIYNITLTGANPAAVEPETVEIEATVPFNVENGELYIDACEENYAWCLSFTISGYDGYGNYEVAGLYSTDNDYSVFGTLNVSYDEFQETDMIMGTLKTADESLVVLVTLYKEAGEDIPAVPVEISNLTTSETQVGEVKYLQLMGSNDMEGVELMLFIPDYTGENKEYALDLNNSSLTLGGTELTLVEGALTKSTDDEKGNVFAGRVVATAEEEGETVKVALDLTMWSAPAIEIEIEDATCVVEQYPLELGSTEMADMLIMTADWTSEDGVVYPVVVNVREFDATAFGVDHDIDFEIGRGETFLGLGDGVAAVFVKDGVVSIEAEVTAYNGTAFSLMISGKLPQDPGTGLDNININVKTVKMIKNGMLIINKGGREFNAQGAILK